MPLGAKLLLRGGRHDPCSVTVTRFAFRTDKIAKASRGLVYLPVCVERIRLACSTGEKGKQADWNADRQQFRRSYPLLEATRSNQKQLLDR